MSKLKDAVVDFVDDVTSIEAAIVKKESSGSTNLEVLSYSKTELEGDSINFFPTTSNAATDEELTQLQIDLNKSSSRVRQAIIKMAVTAIS